MLILTQPFYLTPKVELHNIKKFPGVTGNISFTKNGDVTGKQLYFKIVKHGEFQYIKK